MDSWTYLPQLLASGITVGAIYALVALSFVTITRASQIINFAQGEFVMLGGVLTFFLLKDLSPSYPLAASMAIGIVVMVGFLMYLSVIYPLRKAPMLIPLIATLGASIFLSNTSGFLFGTLPKALPPFSGEQPFQILRCLRSSPESLGLGGNLSPPGPSLSPLPPNFFGKSDGSKFHRSSGC